MTTEREDTSLLGFSTLTPLPGPNVGELPSITAFTFTTKSPENTPLTSRASTLSNPDPVISLVFVEANYEVLESLLRKRRRSPRARRHRGRVMEFEYALNKDGSRVERESNDRRPSE
ncbi:hypothetical protein Tco_0083790 [Tanacetum coccineum]